MKGAATTLPKALPVSPDTPTAPCGKCVWFKTKADCVETAASNQLRRLMGSLWSHLDMEKVDFFRGFQELLLCQPATALCLLLQGP